MTFDVEFTPVRREEICTAFPPCKSLMDYESRLVVTSESEWQELEGYLRLHELKNIALKLPAKILINAEVLFSGDDGAVFDGDGIAMLNGRHGWHNLEMAGDGIQSLNLSHIIQRLCQTSEGSKAELYWWVGESIDWFVEFDNQIDEAWVNAVGNVSGNEIKQTLQPSQLQMIECLESVHIGTTKANESKLESISHLVKGVWTK